MTLVLTKYAITNSFITLFDFQFTLLSISILFITASGYIINDIFDVQADIINKPAKVFIDTTIPKKKAYIVYFTLSILGFLLGIYASYIKGNISYSLFFISTIILLFWYSKSLKRIAFIGNIVVSFLTALTIFIVFVFELESVDTASNIFEAIVNFLKLIPTTIALLCYLIFAFSINLIREIIKDTEDIKGDYSLKMKTLPILIGINRTKNVALFISAFVFLFLVFILKEELIHFQLLFWYAIVFIILPFAWFIYKLNSAKTNSNFSRLSTLLKLIMCFGILSMLFIKL
ncbi:MAG: geranylgeranylglycerol-phosphate geranylgeranyltransferase [Polaribacter sp.]|nr:geranylgeranylglycerol-phosphate geranylgeranyltransferase [Polaribacter sp.]MDG1811949.1 geranylgeranylglycerol-phosphate geranylgeranyltransferase [Polaribacter sp.]MDG1992995.1 geranylgeranylglycerol-phosphate geranylgeranyltransferase [Polaribacter sp.]